MGAEGGSFLRKLQSDREPHQGAEDLLFGEGHPAGQAVPLAVTVSRHSEAEKQQQSQQGGLHGAGGGGVRPWDLCLRDGER